ncbi:MAG TPA: hypothetical protein VG298_07715 [Acidimicrobiales bacterium]|nr:hypothetical protein [Acidimicrobiales bacterium]
MFSGMGGRGMSGLRMVRLGVVVVFLILAATLHGRGSTYNTLHVVYLVVIVVLLVATFAGRGRRSGGPRGRMGGGGGGAFGSPPSPGRPPGGMTENPDPEAGTSRQ